MTNMNRAKDLLDSYLNNTCSPAEKQQVEDWLNNFSNEDNAWLNFTEPQKQIWLDALMKDIDQTIDLQMASTERKTTRLWPKVLSAAAVIAVIISAGVYFFSPEKNTKQLSEIITVKTNIPAGGNKATLTLAGGKVIDLSDSDPGVIAAQAGSTITKTKEGQLVYQGHSLKQGQDSPANSISTPRGGQYQVELPDGTKVWLNAASTLKYPAYFTGPERKVELSGEAYFEVAHNKAKPFKVLFSHEGKTQEIEVLGTHFNISSYPDESAATTTLLEGSVKVKNGSNQNLVLVPGQQSVSENGHLSARTANTEEAIAWKNGYFQFTESDLGGIMRQLSRWYNIEVTFKDNRKADELFHFKASRNLGLNDMLKIFELNGIKLKIERRTLIVEP